MQVKANHFLPKGKGRRVDFFSVPIATQVSTTISHVIWLTTAFLLAPNPRIM